MLVERTKCAYLDVAWIHERTLIYERRHNIMIRRVITETVVTCNEWGDCFLDVASVFDHSVLALLKLR